jgi:hypothetical protein
MAKVFGMHALELKPDVNIKEFEEFVTVEVLPLYRKVPGQTIHLLKGDQGKRDTKYMMFIEIESPMRRDQIYPAEGGVSEEVQQILGNTDAIWDKFMSFVVEFPDPNYTDYVIVD